MTPQVYRSRCLNVLCGTDATIYIKVRSGSGPGPVRLFPKGPGPVRSGKSKGPTNTSAYIGTIPDHIRKERIIFTAGHGVPRRQGEPIDIIRYRLGICHRKIVEETRVENFPEKENH